MTKEQKLVFEFLIESDENFISNIIELEGSYQSISEDVAEAFSKLTEIEVLEVIQKSVTYLLKRKGSEKQ